MKALDIALAAILLGSIVACVAQMPNAIDKELTFREQLYASRCERGTMPIGYCADYQQARMQP